MDTSDKRSVRVRNLSALLTAVHRTGGASRAALTLATTLNRSTVGALVGELAELGLVVETQPAESGGVGRPSPVVVPADGLVVAALVPEADAVTVALVGLGGRILARRRIARDAPPRAEELPALAAATLDDLRREAGGPRILTLGVAVPGLVRASDGLVRLAPHLGWRDAPLGSMLEKACDVPVLLANDATLGAIAESVFGAARGHADAVYLNGGSSGIGGGILAGGVPLTGSAGYAGEFGHTHVADDDKRDAAGVPGTLESEVTRESLLRVLGLGAVDADALEAALVASADPVVLAEVDRQLDYVATTVGTVVNILNPQVLVLGGFLAALDAARPGRLTGLLRDRAMAVPLEALEVRRAELGSDLLVIGAAELALGPILAEPNAVAGRDALRAGRLRR
ncbi:MAG: transcriptional regulator [Naasia sp.]|nr:transcriptional regulator [Naasia sp.]